MNYLHCDPTASHYLKMILDMIFGAQNFRSEIVWKRSSAHSDTKQGRKIHGHIHDTILFYTKSDTWIWNPQYTEYEEDYIKQFYRHIEPETGRRYRLSDLTAARPGGDTLYEWRGVKPYTSRYWAYSKENMEQFEREGRLYYSKSGMPSYKRYLDEMPGVPLQDFWPDIKPIGASASERLGYPTQKPVALLERIIKASSNPGDIVLDPFCGCGTAIIAAEKLGRRWIGIDVTHLAVALMKARLRRDFELEPGKDYQVEGMPESVESAQYLFDSDPFQFQFWAVGLIGAQPYGATAGNKKGKKGGDTGIDGQLYFRTPGGEKLERAIVSVKGGKSLNPSMVRDLRGVVEREKAALGILICMHEPTKGMKEEAAIAGLYSYGGCSVPKIQILTVPELLDGKMPQLPEGALNVSLESKTVKTAETSGQGSLFSS